MKSDSKSHKNQFAFKQKIKTFISKKSKENPAFLLLVVTVCVGTLGFLFSLESIARNQPIFKPLQEKFRVSVQAECGTTKAGFNPGQGLPLLNDPKYYERMKQYGMTSILGIAESTGSDIGAASAFVEMANANRVTPIIRFCVATSSCDSYKDPNAMAGFIREVAKAGKFAVILGPNEPDIEHWNGTNFFELGKFSAEVATQLQDLNQVELLSVAFNASHHLNMNLKNDPSAQYPEVQEISDYFSGLGDTQLLDGIAMNAYNVDGVMAADRVDYFLGYMKANGFGLEGNFNKVYITEFGYFKNRMPSLNQLKDSYSRISSNPNVAGILFFVPFDDLGNPGFEDHLLSSDELGGVLDVSSECIEQGAEEPVVTPVSPGGKENEVEEDQESDEYEPGTGLVIQSKLEYCPVDRPASANPNCIPYARYYDEEPNELLSCQTEGLEEKNTLNASTKLTYDAKTNSYKGQILLAARIRNFPMLRHFGSVRYGEYGQNDVIYTNSEGTLYNPYQPVCSFLSEIFPANGQSMFLTHEFDGKVVFYDSKGSSYEYSMPRLGNGISCLNLLSSLNPKSSVGGHLNYDFPGFSTFTMTKEEKKLASCRTKHALLIQNRASYEEILDIIEKDEDCNYETLASADTVDRQYNEEHPISSELLSNWESGQPLFDYSEEYYCAESDTYSGETIRYVNNGSNRSSESYKGPAKIVGVQEVTISLDTECKKQDSLFNIRDASNGSLKPFICDGSPEVADAYLPTSEIEIPSFIGIPGGNSAYSILTEYVQASAENKVGKIVTPPNGVRVIAEFATINSNGNAYEMGEEITSSSFDRNDKATVEYIVPYMDYQPLFVALQYVFNNSNDDAVHNGFSNEN